jgi:hypothetical protein
METAVPLIVQSNKDGHALKGISLVLISALKYAGIVSTSVLISVMMGTQMMEMVVPQFVKLNVNGNALEGPQFEKTLAERHVETG